MKAYFSHPLLTAASLIILLVVAVRIPSLAEPYWYGDEGIYLTIGTALNNGAILYKDIVDHKTPLIYYFARVGSQLNFRVLLTIWMVATSLAFFASIYRLTKRILLSAVTTTAFVLATSLPLLEGTIPNGELFVMGFVLVGLWLLLRTNAGLALFDGSAASTALGSKSRLAISQWFLVGVCLGGAILTKIPALFDAAALFFIGWLVGWDRQLAVGWRLDWKSWLQPLKFWGVLMLGLLTPIVVSVAYFISIGAGKEYLEFGLLYNFHYVQNWSIGHLPSWGQTIFSLPVKALILIVALTKLTLLGHWIARPVRWSTGWLFLALFASILSNRPYPHYLLQVVPPLVLSLGLVWHEVTRKRQKPLTSLSRLMTAGAGLTSIIILTVVWSSLRIGSYPVVVYYQTFLKLATGQLSATAYRDSFNPYLADNYKANRVLRSTTEKQIFIWGTNPMLYALSGKQPVGRFTVAFHIEDLKLYQATMEVVRATAPPFVVVMKDQSTPLPGLESFLRLQYLPDRSYEYFTIWRRRQVK